MKFFFRSRKMVWPVAVKAPPVDPEVFSMLKRVKEHVKLCVERNEPGALSELHLIAKKMAAPAFIEQFIRETTEAKVWFKLRSELLEDSCHK